MRDIPMLYNNMVNGVEECGYGYIPFSSQSEKEFIVNYFLKFYLGAPGSVIHKYRTKTMNQPSLHIAVSLAEKALVNMLRDMGMAYLFKKCTIRSISQETNEKINITLDFYMNDGMLTINI